MKTKNKKIVAVLACVSLLFSFIVMPVSAADTDLHREYTFDTEDQNTTALAKEYDAADSLNTLGCTWQRNEDKVVDENGNNVLWSNWERNAMKLDGKSYNSYSFEFRIKITATANASNMVMFPKVASIDGTGSEYIYNFLGGQYTKLELVSDNGTVTGSKFWGDTYDLNQWITFRFVNETIDDNTMLYSCYVNDELKYATTSQYMKYLADSTRTIVRNCYYDDIIMHGYANKANVTLEYTGNSAVATVSSAPAAEYVLFKNKSNDELIERAKIGNDGKASTTSISAGDEIYAEVVTGNFIDKKDVETYVSIMESQSIIVPNPNVSALMSLKNNGDSITLSPEKNDKDYMVITAFYTDSNMNELNSLVITDASVKTTDVSKVVTIDYGSVDTTEYKKVFYIDNTLNALSPLGAAYIYPEA